MLTLTHLSSPPPLLLLLRTGKKAGLTGTELIVYPSESLSWPICFFYHESTNVKKISIYLTITYFIVFFVLHVLTVHLHHPVSWSQPAQLGAGAGLHFADELSASVPLALQVKPVSARPFRQETQPRSQLTLHRRASKEGRGRISGQ